MTLFSINCFPLYVTNREMREVFDFNIWIKNNKLLSSKSTFSLRKSRLKSGIPIKYCHYLLCFKNLRKVCCKSIPIPSFKINNKFFHKTFNRKLQTVFQFKGLKTNFMGILGKNKIFNDFSHWIEKSIFTKKFHLN